MTCSLLMVQWYPYGCLNGISVGCNLALLYSVSVIPRYRLVKNRVLDNFVGAEHPADLAEIASLEGFNLATLIEMKLPDSGAAKTLRGPLFRFNADSWVDRHDAYLYRY